MKHPTTIALALALCACGAEAQPQPPRDAATPSDATPAPDASDAGELADACGWSCVLGAPLEYDTCDPSIKRSCLGTGRPCAATCK
jgi:hypothetical protein